MLPEGGILKKVTVYMSEFGKKMTAIEAKEGPRLADVGSEYSLIMIAILDSFRARRKT